MFKSDVMESLASEMSCTQMALKNYNFNFTNRELLIDGVTKILNSIGISASLMGYHYLRSAILIVLEHENSIIGITKGLYPDVAKIYKTTASRVERAMRHAIASAWKNGGGDAYCTFIGFNCAKKPTNGQFIACIAERIRLFIKYLPKVSA